MDGYNFSAQSMSDLGASGSPVRSLVLGLTCVACALMVAFAVGAVAFGGWLRILSIAIPVGYVVFAVLRFARDAPATDTASLIGTQERTMAFSFLFWVVALAINLLLSSGSGTPANPTA